MTSLVGKVGYVLKTNVFVLLMTQSTSGRANLAYKRELKQELTNDLRKSECEWVNELREWVCESDWAKELDKLSQKSEEKDGCLKEMTEDLKSGISSRIEQSGISACYLYVPNIEYTSVQYPCMYGRNRISENNVTSRWQFNRCLRKKYSKYRKIHVHRSKADIASCPILANRPPGQRRPHKGEVSIQQET